MLAGKYRVEQVLGSGGMGVVVAAWHTELEQRVAVKFLNPVALERSDTAERFRREARAAAKIRSEHVARVIDVGTMDGGLPYMVMEYLEGHDISEEMRMHGLLPVSDSVHFVLQAIEALAEAHSAGIVHRDLKPANLFLALRPDGTRIVKVLDFGISKSLIGGSVAELSLTRTAALIGSPLYMSPEQMRSAKDVDIRTDIWSLGVILYEMLTGQPPYTGDSIPALCASLLNDSPRPMHQLRPEISPQLEEVVGYCLAKNREHRYANVGDLARALAPFGNNASQMHVDRTSRVLGVTDPTLNNFSMAPATNRLGGMDSRSPAQLAVSGRPVSSPGTPARGTVDSWGRTDAPVPGSVAPRKKRLWLGAMIAVWFVALLGVGAWFGTRNRNLPAAAESSASVASPALVANTLPSPPVVTPSAAVPAIAAETPTAVPTLVLATPDTKPKPQLAAGSKTHAPPAKKNLPTDADLSDFGGRR